MKPSFSFSEMCTLISLIDCRKDVNVIADVVMAEKKRYTINELYTMQKLLQIRMDKFRSVL